MALDYVALKGTSNDDVKLLKGILYTLTLIYNELVRANGGATQISMDDALNGGWKNR